MDSAHDAQEISLALSTEKAVFNLETAVGRA